MNALQIVLILIVAGIAGMGSVLDFKTPPIPGSGSEIRGVPHETN